MHNEMKEISLKLCSIS